MSRMISYCVIRDRAVRNSRMAVIIGINTATIVRNVCCHCAVRNSRMTVITGINTAAVIHSLVIHYRAPDDCGVAIIAAADTAAISGRVI